MAAERTETLVKEYILSGGYILSVYTVTVQATDDWVVLSGAEKTRFASGYTTSDGTDALCYVSGTNNRVFFATNSGATTFMVLHTSVKSTGGAT